MEAKQLTGSQAVLEAFIAEGVDTIFGYPGGAIMPIYDALYDYQEKLKHILVRHEQGGIHAGQGYARTSGKVGVVFATSGPGATNLVTGLADAMIDSTPLVCITGQVFAHLLGYRKMKFFISSSVLCDSLRRCNIFLKYKYGRKALLTTDNVLHSSVMCGNSLSIYLK